MSLSLSLGGRSIQACPLAATGLDLVLSKSPANDPKTDKWPTTKKSIFQLLKWMEPALKLHCKSGELGSSLISYDPQDQQNSVVILNKSFWKSHNNSSWLGFGHYSRTEDSHTPRVSAWLPQQELLVKMKIMVKNPKIISHAVQKQTEETREQLSLAHWDWSESPRSTSLQAQLSSFCTSTSGSLRWPWERIPLVFPWLSRLMVPYSIDQSFWHLRRLHLQEVFFREFVWLKTIVRILIVASQQEHLHLGWQSRTLECSRELVHPCTSTHSLSHSIPSMQDTLMPSRIYILKLVELKKLTPKSAKSCRNKKVDSKNC